jgi:hypothetical protein
VFSFRTTSLEEQLDKALQEGRVGCFCTQNCWDTQRGRYMYDIFRERGNLQLIFNPRDTELTPLTNHIEFVADDLRELNAVVVEIQDVGARYFNYTKDVMRLMEVLKEMKEEAPLITLLYALIIPPFSPEKVPAPLASVPCVPTATFAPW